MGAAEAGVERERLSVPADGLGEVLGSALVMVPHAAHAAFVSVEIAGRLLSTRRPSLISERETYVAAKAGQKAWGAVSAD